MNDPVIPTGAVYIQDNIVEDGGMLITLLLLSTISELPPLLWSTDLPASTDTPPSSVDLLDRPPWSDSDASAAIVAILCKIWSYPRRRLILFRGRPTYAVIRKHFMVVASLLMVAFPAESIFLNSRPSIVI